MKGLVPWMQFSLYKYFKLQIFSIKLFLFIRYYSLFRPSFPLNSVLPNIPCRHWESDKHCNFKINEKQKPPFKIVWHDCTSRISSYRQIVLHQTRHFRFQLDLFVEYKIPIFLGNPTKISIDFVFLILGVFFF